MHVGINTKYFTRCPADKFRTTRSQNRIISNVNRYLNGGKLVKSEPLPVTKLPVLNEQPVKRDNDCKARRKRINRRLEKGKPVEKGILRDSPKSLEYRLAEGVKLENRETNFFSKNNWKLSQMEIIISGTAHVLTAKMVRADSPEEIEAREDALRIYDSYFEKVHGPEKSHRLS